MAGCGDDDAAVDGGADAGSDATVADGGVDSGSTADTGNGDVGMDGGDGCIQVATSGWTLANYDDVSVSFSGVMDPAVEGSTPLMLLFERYMPGPDVGTFPLGGSGPDGNFGTCAHCVAVHPEATRGFFADRGTLVNNEDPYGRSLDSTLTNVRLVEVSIDPETRSSTPIDGGRCLEIEDVVITGRFPPDGWACDADLYNDGEGCHCECGAYDPDCDRHGCPPFDPECVPEDDLPVVDCRAEDVCAFDPEADSTRCYAVCDWSTRTSCDIGTCVFPTSFEDGSTCHTSDARLDTARVGEDCGPGPYQKYCELQDGFALGYCDPANVCRATCIDDGECTEVGHTCRRFGSEDGLGYCGPEPVDG